MVTASLLWLWKLFVQLLKFLFGIQLDMQETTPVQNKSMSTNGSTDCQDSFSVNVTTVDARNISQMMPAMEKAVRGASFCALDVEFSGLGDRTLLSANLIDDRYVAMSSLADSRSILGIGISCFKKRKRCGCLKEEQENCPADKACCQGLRFSSHTFNILLHSRDTYAIDPDAALFLVQHDFDFNQLFRHGIRFYKGNVETEVDDIHKLFRCLIEAKPPVILHNGLLDLCFLYRHFYGVLPAKLQTFVADLSEMFSGGVYDTKFISMFHTSNHMTQLEYTFKKCLQGNHHRSQTEEPYASVVSKSKSSWNQDSPIACCPVHSQADNKQLQKLCKYFLKNGHCTNSSCEKLHSVDLILMKEQQAKVSKKQRKRKLDNQNDGRPCKGDGSHNKNIKLVCPSQCDEDIQKSNCHQAGYDAFMTGYIFACFLATFGMDKVFHIDSEMRNRLPLARKDIPLQIVKSHFAATSGVHNKNTASKPQ